jgi:CheY-like chemotaxis protein
MKTALVVEDDSLARKSIAASLKDAGLAVTTAEDGQQGLETALATHPDLIVADLKMPKMNGMEMIAAIRKDDWGKHVPIVILTSDQSMDTMNKALESGVTVYLNKADLDYSTLADQILLAVQ